MTASQKNFLLATLVVFQCGVSFVSDAETADPRRRLIRWADKPWVDVPGLTSGVNGSGGQADGSVENGMGTSASGAAGGSLLSGASGGSRAGSSGSSVSGSSAARSGSSGGSSGSSASSSSGGTSPGDSSQAGPKIGFDDNAPKNGGGGGGGGGGKAIAYPLWYPMCLFIDQTIDTGTGNSAVKGIIDDAAACGVNLVVFPLTVKSNYPNSADTINAKAQKSCNVIEGLGVPRASVSTCVQFPDTAGEMCGEPPETRPTVAGCAQLQSGASNGWDAKTKAAMKQSGEGTESAGGVAAPSIEKSGACDTGTVGHEALGHSMWGHPNGSADGHGIGVTMIWNPNATDRAQEVLVMNNMVKDLARHARDLGLDVGAPPDPMLAVGIRTRNGVKVAAEGGGAGGGGWTGEGCAAMRGSAFANDGRWKYDPSRQQYYVRAEPERQWDLMEGKQLFLQPPGAPPPGDATPPTIGGQPPTTITFDDNFFKSIGADGAGAGKGTSGPQGGGAAGGGTASADERHRRPQGPLTATLSGSGGGAAANTYKQSGEDGNAINPPRLPDPPPGGGGKGSAKIGFDDDAPKNGSNSGASVQKGGSFATKVDQPPGDTSGITSVGSNSGAIASMGSGPGSGSRLNSDDNAPRGGYSLGGKGSSIGYDDSAPKNGSTASASSSGGGVVGLGGGSRGIDPNAGSITSQIKAAGSTLDDGFFKQVGDFAEEEREREKQRKLGAKRIPGSTLRVGESPTRIRGAIRVEGDGTHP